MAESAIGQVFAKGVGQRIVGFFLLAAILPMLFTSWLAYHEFSRGVEREASRILKAQAKEYASEILTRLQFASEKADEIVRLTEDGGVNGFSSNAYLLADFDAIWRAEENIPPVLVAGQGNSSLSPSLANELFLNDPTASLVLTPEKELLLFKDVVGSDALSTNYVFFLNGENVWGSRQELPYSAEFCIFSGAGMVLSCTSDVDPGIHAALVNAGESRNSSFAEWTRGDEKQVAALWQLFLEGTFGAEPIDIVAVQELGLAMNAVADYWRVFLPATVLVLVLAGLLSLNLIARSLVPLRHLTAAVRKVASGNLGARVRISTGDEFQSLADAFNNMTVKLSRQISTLEALSGIDRMILSGTKFEEVAEDVVKHLVGLIDCNAAAVIVRDADAPHKAKMISLYKGEYCHERVDVPSDLHQEQREPRQIDISDMSPLLAPYRDRFLGYGQKYAFLIPVTLNNDVKGILVLGMDSEVEMAEGNLKRCTDLAGRFAVALASVEREESLYRQAHFDPLTGLPNRQLLKDRLEQHLASARIEEHSGALLFLDLDRFKQINDVYGHSAGDQLLVQASERIISEVRTRDTVARLGGDEFVIALPSVRNDSIVTATAERLLMRIAEAFTINGVDHYVSGSIGIVVFPDDGDSVELLLKNADAAMYRAKEAGRNRFEFFSERLNAESRRKITLERDLRQALHNEELSVWYQPQFDISSGQISGAEALLRWNHSTDGVVSPAEFIPLAEESDLIVEIGSWVLEQACKDLCHLLDQGLHPGPMSINVSARQLRKGSFEADVMTPIRRYGIHPGYIQLEVTETTVAQNRDTAIEILANLRKQGVRVSIDDFGTGYSSLSYLQHMPFDTIKIDKSFVDVIGSGDVADNICRTIIRMAEELGKKSIAEGVEQGEQVAFLQENGCDFIQGYFYSKPLSQQEFVKFVSKQDFHTQRRKALEII